ncbi:MAG TPA: hypothetical protein VEX43_04870 [Chthoniobacterales bacterium]|nr:hypothetical protein [Chthoniobacterales bacterium]
MKTKAKLAVVTLLAICAFSMLNAAGGDLPYYGSQLKDLDTLIEKAPGKTLFIKVDQAGGSSASINVQIHEFPGTIKEYMDLSKAQFAQFFEKGWKVLSEKQNEKEASCEVVGTTKGKEYHSYSRAVKEGNKLYVITATALHEQWGNVGEKMRRHVDAFKAK